MAERPQLPALTGLRFVAAAQVLLYHLFPRRMLPESLQPLLASGYVGVSLFFVLSGFVLTYNYQETVAAGTISWRTYLTARLARIYPVYLLGLVVALPTFFLGSRPAAEVAHRLWPSVSASVVMAQAWSPRTACVVNCPGWSISVEALFYLAFAPAAILLARFGRRGLTATAAVSWLLAILLPLLYLALDPDGPLRATPESGAAWLLRLKYHPLARLPEFVMGMAAAGLFMRRPQGDARWERLEVAAAGVLVGVLLLSDRIPYPLLHNGLLAPVSALLIYRLARGTGPIATALSGRRLEMLGGASYALYILHVPVGSWLTAALSAVALSPPPLLRFALSAGLSLTAAVLVFRRFEEPARRWVRRVTAPRAQLRPVLAGD